MAPQADMYLLTMDPEIARDRFEPKRLDSLWNMRRLGSVRTLGKVTCVAAAVAFLSVLARGSMVSEPSAEGPRTAPAVAANFVPSSSLAARPIIPIAASSPRFGLDDPDALGLARPKFPRVNAASGRREDTVIAGDFAAIEAPYLRITVTEGGDAEPPRSLFVTLARRGAEGHGLSVVKTGERGSLDTKFGPVETLEATLSGEGTRICTGFATVGSAAVRIDGWLCAPLGQPPEPRAVVCALDKLVLNGQASPGFESRFREAETRRVPVCRTQLGTAASDTGGRTGSIEKRHIRKNKAELRRTAQARP